MDYSKYIDPMFLDKITYFDKDRKRRVKNPYRNRKSYAILVQNVNASGDFVFTVPSGVAGKSVFVEFPSKVIYQFTVNASTNEVTVKGIPVFTYIEVNVVTPKPLPNSTHDLYWDDLEYDAQKSIVAAWGEIDLICNVLYPASAESELGFDDQNTIKYGLVGWKNNCGNDKNTDWDRPVAPANSVYHPPQPIPTPPPEPEPELPPVDPEVGHDYDYKFVLRWEDNSRADLDFYAFLDHSTAKKVYYGNRNFGSGNNMMWLDMDYTYHDENGFNSQPEIITIIGYKNSVVSLQINNYNKGTVLRPATLEIITYDKLSQRYTTLTSYHIPAYYLSGSKSHWICDFDLSTGKDTSKFKEISSVGTFN